MSIFYDKMPRPIISVIGDCPDLNYAGKFSKAWNQLAKDSFLIFTGGAVGSPTIQELTNTTVPITIMNKLKVRLAVPSTHELKHGIKWFKRLANRSRFPWVATNLNSPHVANLHIEDIGGARVGFIGVVNAPVTSVFTTSDPIVAAVESAKSLRVLCDFVVVMSQCEPEVTDQVCVALANENLADVVIIGSNVDPPNNNKGIVMIQPGRKFDSFVVHNLLNACSANIKIQADFDEDALIVSGLKSVERSMVKKLKNVLTYCENDIDCRKSCVRKGPSEVGAFLCDSYFLINNKMMDVVAIHGGMIGIDDIIQAGPMTLHTLADMLPHDTHMAVFEMNGATLAKIVKIGENEEKKGSGLNLNFSLSLKTGDECTVHDKVVLPDELYDVCVPCYLIDHPLYVDVFTSSKLIYANDELPTMHVSVHDYFKSLYDYDDLGIAGKLAETKRRIRNMFSSKPKQPPNNVRFNTGYARSMMLSSSNQSMSFQR